MGNAMDCLADIRKYPKAPLLIFVGTLAGGNAIIGSTFFARIAASRNK